MKGHQEENTAVNTTNWTVQIIFSYSIMSEKGKTSSPPWSMVEDHGLDWVMQPGNEPNHTTKLITKD